MTDEEGIKEPSTPGHRRTALEAAKLGEDCSEKVFLITGPYAGLGSETVKALLSVGAKKIILGGRNEKLQEEFVQKLKNEGFDTAEKIDATNTIDLGDLQTVQAYASYVRSTYPTIDVLILNAGIMNTPPGVTKDGIEQQMGVNVVGHFLLAKMLVEQTKRQVWLSSYAHTLLHAPRLNLDYIKEFSMEKKDTYDGWLAYQQSKLGNILVAREFPKRFSHLESVSLHPGSIPTSLSRHTSIMSVLRISAYFLSKIYSDFREIGVKNVQAGAATTVTCATLPSDKLVPGGYYMNCEEGGDRENAKNEEDMKALFDYCDEVTKAFQ